MSNMKALPLTVKLKYTANVKRFFTDSQTDRESVTIGSAGFFTDSQTDRESGTIGPSPNGRTQTRILTKSGRAPQGIV